MFPVSRICILVLPDHSVDCAPRSFSSDSLTLEYTSAASNHKAICCIPIWEAVAAKREERIRELLAENKHLEEDVLSLKIAVRIFTFGYLCEILTNHDQGEVSARDCGTGKRLV